jgi:hypothetical protein
LGRGELDRRDGKKTLAETSKMFFCDPAMEASLCKRRFCMKIFRFRKLWLAASGLFAYQVAGCNVNDQLQQLQDQFQGVSSSLLSLLGIGG